MLSPAQQETLATFQSITNVSNQRQAMMVLDSHGWDLQAAVDFHFAAHSHDSDAHVHTHAFPTSASPFSAPPSRSRPVLRPSASPSASHSQAPPLSVPASMGSASAASASSSSSSSSSGHSSSFRSIPGGRILSSIVSRISSIISSSVAFIGRFIPFSLLPSNAPPEQVAAAFIAFFESNFGSTHPAFHLGSSLSASQTARQRSKLLVMYLHADHHPDAVQFASNVLADSTFASFLDESFVVWGASITSAEGYQAAQMLQVTRYPFIAVLAHQGSSSQLQCIYKKEGPEEMEPLMHQLTDVLERFGAVLAAERAERESLEVDRRLREEQNERYERALALAQQREEEEQRRAEEERKQQEEQEAREREEREAQNRLVAKKEAKRASFLAIPEPEPSQDVATIQIRLLGGSKVQRRFKASDSIQMLYDFVDCQDMEFEGSGAYDLFMTYPRQALTEKQQTVLEAGLMPQATLFVKEQ